MALLQFPRTLEAERPYSHLAVIYDALMAHVDYRAWARYVADILSTHGIRDARVLDIACGTGTFLFALQRLGYQVAGLDGSESMIRQARENDARRGAGISFAVADMRRFAAAGQDAIVCLYDSLNYLLTPQDVLAALRQVYQALRPGGLFIFDVCTEVNSLKHFNGFVDRGECHGVAYTRESSYRRRRRLQINHFTLRLPGRTDPIHEHHQQRIYTMPELTAILVTTPFLLKHVYDEFTLRVPTDASSRLHVVLEKPPRAPAWPEAAPPARPDD